MSRTANRPTALAWMTCAALIGASAAAQTAAPAASPPASAPASAPATTSAASTSAPALTKADLRRQFAIARMWLAKPVAARSLDAFAPAADIRYREYAEPRPLRLWIAKVDMQAEGVRAIVSPAADFKSDADPENDQFEIRCQNTLEFAQQYGVQLAINTSAFGPFRGRAGEPMEVAGLAAVDGQVFSPPQGNYGSLFIGRDRRVSLKGPATEADARDVWIAAPGFEMLLDDGKLVVTPKRAASGFGNLNPRTAVGVDPAGRYLWIVTVDGRQPDSSMGMTLVELAALFDELGCWDALNLDGGGSTTFVLQYSDGKPYVTNTPSGSKLRQVANNLGLFLPGQPPATQPATGGPGPASAPAAVSTPAASP